MKREEAYSAASVSCLIGGAKRDRTADLLNAIQAQHARKLSS